MAIYDQACRMIVSARLSCPNKHINLLTDKRSEHRSFLIAGGLHELPIDEASVLNKFRCARAAGYRNGGRNGCLKGTRRAIMDEIELWMGDFGKPPVYWLNGLAGTGKSTIAQTIAERVFAAGQLGASFFCSRDFEDRSDLHLIFPTLAVQLARKYTEFRSILVPLIRSDRGVADETLYHQMKRLIIHPLEESRISTVIVIDALDECKDEQPTSAILSVLGKLVSEIPKVKFFLTGRPEPRIQEGFRLLRVAEAAEVFVLHKIESSQANSDIQLSSQTNSYTQLSSQANSDIQLSSQANSDIQLSSQVDSDIRLFLRHEFSELASRQRGLDDWPTEEQLDLLCERAEGLFVYAVTTIKFVGDVNNSPKKQLDLLLQSPESSSHEGKTQTKANSPLDLLYMSILQGTFSNNNLEVNPNIRSILGAVILAANPLSPSTIATFLGLGVNEVSSLLLSMHSFLIFQEDINHPVQPFHKSFPDFIVNPARCTDQRFCISLPDHHSKLLVGCLGLMNQRLEENICKIPDAVANSEVDGLQEKIEQHIDHGLQYACRSWHRHLVHAPHTLEITHTLDQFLREKFLFWLEVLSILGTTRTAVDALEVATTWFKVCPIYMLNTFSGFTHAGSRDHQPLNLSMTTFDLSLDPLRSSAHLPCISTTQPSPYPPKHQLCVDCTNSMLIP
jgi:hypothetical protein